MNTRLRRSAIHVSNAPRMRLDSPPSVVLSLVATPFSISSIHSTQGAIASADFSASRRLRSVSPRNLLYSAPKSRRISGTPHAPATALAARLLPQPCTPSSMMPLGTSRPSGSIFVEERGATPLEPAL